MKQLAQFASTIAIVFAAKFAVSQPFIEVSDRVGFGAIKYNNGVAVADYDNDGDLDVFIVSRWVRSETEAKSQLFRNDNNGKFTDVTALSGIDSRDDYTRTFRPGPYDFGSKMSASWGDFNNDGYQDLFLTNLNKLELYKNNQDGTFSNVTSQSGIEANNSCYNTGALWLDINNDTYLDLYLTGLYSCLEKNLYLNNQDGTFSDISIDQEVNLTGPESWMAIPWDLNKDGFQDIYITNDFDLSNELLINRNGAGFTSNAADYNLLVGAKDGMGLALNDFNRDGLLDVYVTNIDESSLHQNLNNQNFNDVAPNYNLDKTGWAWGVSFADFDHDLDEDILVLNGFFTKSGNRFYQNQLETGELRFEDLSDSLGLSAISFSNSVVAFDYDNDGDLDLIVSNSDDALNFFENRRIQLESNSTNWVQVELEGTISNPNAVGTSLKAVLSDGTILSRYKHGSAFMAQSQQPVHLGLKNFSKIDSLYITWPTGAKSTYLNVPVNSFLKIKEGQEIAVLNRKPSLKKQGCTDPDACNYDPDALENDNSCQYLESKTIVGVSSASVLAIENYSYQGNEGSSYRWEVENGEIISGQGTPELEVQWGVGGLGRLTVQERNGCVGLKVSQEVQLSADQIPEYASIARLWNEVLLEAIRNDFARPTIHARNLFHTSVAMYDSWAVFQPNAQPYLLGNELYNYTSEFEGFETTEEKSDAIAKVISYACYRLLTHRFQLSPNYQQTEEKLHELMVLLGYDVGFTSTDYSNGDPAALGNFIGQSLIDFGRVDGSREDLFYSNIFYQPINEPLQPVFPGNPNITDPNRWQPLQLEFFIDQAGNPLPGNTPEFLSPEWGNVHPFALEEGESTTYSRDETEYIVYHDPGTPPLLNQLNAAETSLDLYKWNFALVSAWSSHLDPGDGVMWDISPMGIGGLTLDDLPKDLSDHPSFYDFEKGGDSSPGRDINPISGSPYPSQIVPRGDYARVLAEFWADGPDSETPPGHWYVILNYVNDQPDFERKFMGQEDEMDALEWDVKAYFTLGGAMHDAAVSAWSIKGWYDYIRPISAIRYLADQGQCTDPDLPNYSEEGIPLIDGLIEIVGPEDDLAGVQGLDIGKIKVFAWRGHDYVTDTENDQAGVGWILAENWWPYQRPSFVTPPFAGYVSGHSTYSRAAAEVLTRITGSEYFPGGIGEFIARKDEFLVFEQGPSQDVILQWATYRDASDQCSLSRIWGGIHPPADDLPGRFAGERVGQAAVEKALLYFTKDPLEVIESEVNSFFFPNPVTEDKNAFIRSNRELGAFQLFDLAGKKIKSVESKPTNRSGMIEIDFQGVSKGTYILRSNYRSWKILVE